VNASETYRRVEHLLYRTAWEVARQTKLDLDELVSEANEAYLKALDSYDPGRGAFTTHLVVVVRHQLIHFVRWQLRCHRRPHQLKDRPKLRQGQPAERVYVVPSHYRDFKPEDLQDELGDDGRLVVGLTLNPPADLARYVYGTADDRPGRSGPARFTPRRFRAALKRHLRGTLGWSGPRVRRCFADVRQALEESGRD
jgi:RNA polymerase sigma factor (sigma-70 family)